MKALARALSGMCGGLGASGLYPAARACDCAIIDANASDPVPQKQSVKNSRRFFANRTCSGIVTQASRPALAQFTYKNALILNIANANSFHCGRPASGRRNFIARTL